MMHKASQRYPWTCRIEFTDLESEYFLKYWSESKIIGIWAGNSFYTTDFNATLIALKFSG